MPSFWWENDPEIFGIFERTTNDVAQNDVEEQALKYLFDQGFVSEEVTHDERIAGRDHFFAWLGTLGYNPDWFDWNAWRAWYEGS